jgi:hypothetical protein
VERKTVSGIMLTLLAVSSISLIRASAPSVPHKANALWIEPTTLSFNTSTTSVGHLFNVTVFINVTDKIFMWQVNMTYDPTQLAIIKVRYTGPLGTESDFFYPLAASSPGPSPRPGSVLIDEALLGGVAVNGLGGLFWVEFNITAAPTKGALASTLNITNPETWVEKLDYTLPPISKFNTPYTYALAIHDVAVTNVQKLKTVVGKGLSCKVDVTLKNLGWYTETFDVIGWVYITPPALGFQTLSVVNLLPSETRTVTLVWDTSGWSYGNYTMGAVAATVPGETNTRNNWYSDDWIIVAMVGDITGPKGVPDGRVNMYDVALFAAAFDSKPGNPHWNPNCDITGRTPGLPDGRVDMYDVGLLASMFGKHT